MEEETRKQAITRHAVDGETPKSIYTSLKHSKNGFLKGEGGIKPGIPTGLKITPESL